MPGPMRLTGLAATLTWLARRGARGLATDSRRLQPGEAFIAWPGAADDGRRHVRAALAAGAPACLVEAEGVAEFGFDDEPRVAAIEGLKALTGELAAAWYAHPSDTLPVLAVTGTNGKTSTSWWIAGALAALGRRAAVVGTLGVGVPPELVPTGLTTPDPVALQSAFRRFADAGCDAVAIEASSIGLEEQRLAGTRVAVALLTNLTQDHLDYHGSMEAYWQAKARLFAWPGLRAVVVNVDDPYGARLVDAARPGGPALWTYAVGPAAPSARLRADAPAYRDGGLAFTVVESAHGRGASRSAEVRTGLIGDYNVANLLAVIGGLRALGIPLEAAAAACAGLAPVPGRMQRVAPPDEAAAPALPQVVVDYAHTPDALEKALQALRPLARARGGALQLVFGCGGNRDPGKRPRMGAIAEAGADRVLLTSDNPRRESPQAILADIVAGLSHPAAAVVEPDRGLAIARAVRDAAPADVVLVAGKGHEATQEIGTEKRPFSDVTVARDALAARAAADAPMMDLATAAGLLPGARLVGDGATALRRVHSDTRSLRAGDLFVALRGERFDAHDFLPQAAAAGAAAALAERGLAEAGLPGLLVPDTRAALQQLAAAWRRRHALPLVAVTGSNGKTTVTQMLAAVLRAWHGSAAFATEGNLNNDIGLPLTLLRLRPAHRAGVVELGMNHPGEIAALAALAAPTVALVNNAQREHQEFMDGVEAVARENGSVFAALPADGVAVYPADDAQAPVWQALAEGRRTLRFALEGEDGAAPAAELRGRARWDAAGHWAVEAEGPDGRRLAWRLALPGRHNVRNALAVAACALAVGCPAEAIVQGLEGFEPVKGRSRLLSAPGPNGTSLALVDDSYNANPDSVRAAIELLAGLPGPRWLLLGDMGEVGSQGPAFHAEVGAHAARHGIEHLWAAGAASAHAAAAFPGARHFDTVEALLAALPQAPACRAVLVKGSRFMRMERVVAALQGGAALARGEGGVHAA
ncbi:bifunctional UDP-N-acetylmuramoyl-L-alanyl-D-glutamate--2,6-diaminopimelate ligase MurE/UDP-N-acetylmuramoyl-tripeptide--D-alanyl-D-alanine ligase MurF [Piscinibacter sakaiensis]|uniref:Multifunctional fusion protein n=1 Tax=Piscinibacter sakaiensis TaxID=1547922 RepID=A0A0K8P3A6_PISS1|nr:bifunctional UDP-N-acetylmuramoyl-L-alanyl-D-glutamate--2,6-diaminopimelate ligase MurE/UDP-N-acetylmuramoyl-tripeptide--D-alanyl-D-alanine ligase MurF [Piscinibacter sakaiensis]GAP37098.1 UDP-N-acetylmuramoylalanyl-D-glutamyl-2,6-diaminopimelate--D-alanyl-D-alanine ligase [Piscinibacter sakaiensis]